MRRAPQGLHEIPAFSWKAFTRFDRSVIESIGDITTTIASHPVEVGFLNEGSIRQMGECLRGTSFPSLAISIWLPSIRPTGTGSKMRSITIFCTESGLVLNASKSSSGTISQTTTLYNICRQMNRFLPAAFGHEPRLPLQFRVTPRQARKNTASRPGRSTVENRQPLSHLTVLISLTLN